MWCAVSWRQTHGAVTYGLGDGADIRAVDVVADHGSLRFGIEQHGRRLGSVDAAAPGHPQRAQRHRRDRAGTGDRRAVRRLRVGTRPVRRRRPTLRHPRRLARRDLDRRLRAPAHRDRRRARRPRVPVATAGGGWSRSSSRTASTAWRSCGPEYADAFGRRPIVVVLTDIYASGTAPVPGVTGKLVVNAIAGRTSRHARRVVATAPRSDRVPRATSCATATSASRWAAATSRRCRPR